MNHHADEHPAQRRLDRTTAVLIVAGAAAAIVTAVGWFVLPRAPGGRLGGDAFRSSRAFALVVLACALALWTLGVLRRDRACPVPSLRLVGTALLLGGAVMLCAPFSLVQTTVIGPGGKLREEVHLCAGPLRVASTTVDSSESAWSCAHELPGRRVAAGTAMVMGGVLLLSAVQRRRVAGGPLEPRTRRWNPTQRWALPMLAAAIWMSVVDGDRFVVPGRWSSIAIAAAAAWGWLVVADRSTRRPDPHRRSWLAGVLILEVAAVVLVTPFQAYVPWHYAADRSCPNPLAGIRVLNESEGEIEGCLITEPLLVLGALGLLAAGSVLVLLGPLRRKDTPGR